MNEIIKLMNFYILSLEIDINVSEDVKYELEQLLKKEFGIYSYKKVIELMTHIHPDVIDLLR